MDEQSEQSFKTSKYNSAVAQLIRLDNLWNICHTSSLNANYARWNYALDKIWVELSADLEPKDKRCEEYAKLIGELNKTGTIYRGEINGFDSMKSIEQSAPQYAALIKKESWLKRLQNKLGKGTKWADEDEDMM